MMKDSGMEGPRNDTSAGNLPRNLPAVAEAGEVEGMK